LSFFPSPLLGPGSKAKSIPLVLKALKQHSLVQSVNAHIFIWKTPPQFMTSLQFTPEDELWATLTAEQKQLCIRLFRAATVDADSVTHPLAEDRLPPSSEDCSISRLPTDMVRLILQWFSANPVDYYSMMHTCKTFQQLTHLMPFEAKRRCLTPYLERFFKRASNLSIHLLFDIGSLVRFKNARYIKCWAAPITKVTPKGRGKGIWVTVPPNSPTSFVIDKITGLVLSPTKEFPRACIFEESPEMCFSPTFVGGKVKLRSIREMTRAYGAPIWKDKRDHWQKMFEAANLRRSR
jgi:hypothetical protein